MEIFKGNDVSGERILQGSLQDNYYHKSSDAFKIFESYTLRVLDDKKEILKLTFQSSVGRPSVVAHPEWKIIDATKALIEWGKPEDPKGPIDG